MSGVGKTSVGKYISNRLNIEFQDTDDIILKYTGETIDYIFKKYGEDYFRHLEKQAIIETSSKDGVIISTGGGAILKTRNRKVLKDNGVVFFLNADVSTLVSNILSSTSSKGHRPLLDMDNLYNSISKLYAERYELYSITADHIINVDNKSIEEIGNEIIFIFNQYIYCS